MLHSQVQSSEESLQNLVSSSTQLSKTNTEMAGIGAKVKISGGLISKYERREFTDKVLISAALVVFFGVVLYIIQKRTLGWFW
jgi:protein transport protein SEC20